MKNLLTLAALGLALAQPVFATEAFESEAIDSDEVTATAERRNPWGFWSCSAQAPRLIRVFTVKGEGYRDDIQQQALDKCDEKAVLQCWPLGCSQPRR